MQTVLASERFSRCPRLANLLAYLCQKCFEGEADQIKEYNIATEVLGRPSEFDSSQDAIARVEAHRLRKKLKEYYAAEGAHEEIRIVLSPGTYVPLFARARAHSPHVNEALEGRQAGFAETSGGGAELRDGTELEVLARSADVAAVPGPVALQSVRTRAWPYIAFAGCGVALMAVLLWKAADRKAAAAPSSPIRSFSAVPPPVANDGSEDRSPAGGLHQRTH